MTPYQLPVITEPEPIGDNEIILVTSGDLRLSANQECWPAQSEIEEKVKAVFQS
ncbi:unnamed protein product, partial [marine sediment metagenome]